MSEPGFETRLARSLRDLAEDGVRPLDARSVVLATLERSRPRSIWSRGTGARGMLLLGAVVGLLVLAALAALAGLAALTLPRPAGPPTVLFIRDGDLYVAAGDGKGQRLISAGHRVVDVTPGYIRAFWSPDATHILAIRDNDPGFGRFDPVVEVLDPDGRLVTLVDVPDGDVPELAWSPDGRRFAMQTFSGGSQEPGPTVEISLVGLDGRLQATIPGPADVDAAHQPPQMLSDIDSHRLTWSPDGRWIGYQGVRGPAHDPVALFLTADGSRTTAMTPPGAANGDAIVAYGWDRAGATATVSTSCLNSPCAAGLSSYSPDTGAWTVIDTGPVPAPVPASTIVASSVDERSVLWSSPGRGQGMTTVLSVLERAQPEALRVIVTTEAHWNMDETPPPRDPTGEWIAPYPIRWSSAGERIFYSSVAIDGDKPLATLHSIAVTDGVPVVVVERIAWFDVASR